jgi:hypothetical protein
MHIFLGIYIIGTTKEVLLSLDANHEEIGVAAEEKMFIF